MAIIITPSVFTVRRGTALAAYGDPYSDTAVIKRIGDTAYIEAWSGSAPSVAESRCLARELRTHGMTRLAWERRRADGRVHWVKRRINGGKASDG